MIVVLGALISLFLQLSPRLTVSAIQVDPEDLVPVQGAGFTPNRIVFSYLRRPDNTEFVPLRFLTNERGEYSHRIDTSLFNSGIYELWAIDETTKAVSNTIRFRVGFETTSPETLAPYAGVWSGTVEQSAILISITGGTSGRTAGTFAYSSLSCGGVLTFRAIYVDSIELNEVLRYGAERCVNNGIATIKLGKDGGMTYQWRHAKVAGTKSGKLDRN